MGNSMSRPFSAERKRYDMIETNCNNRLVSQVFGVPIWTEDHDGEMRKRRARIQPNGKIIFKGICHTMVGNADGTIAGGCEPYITRWMPRATFLG